MHESAKRLIVSFRETMVSERETVKGSALVCLLLFLLCKNERRRLIQIFDLNAQLVFLSAHRKGHYQHWFPSPVVCFLLPLRGKGFSFHRVVFLLFKGVKETMLERDSSFLCTRWFPFALLE